MDLGLLKRAAIFQDLDEGELARVAEVCREQKFTVGQYIFKEGEPGNRLFLISEGEVERVKQAAQAFVDGSYI